MIVKREPLSAMVPRLVATARGDLPATLVIRKGRLVNVCTREILDGVNVAVQGSRIAYVGRGEPFSIDEKTVVIDAGGRYIAPGFLDGHCHIESSQLTVGQFARAVLPRGTTGGFFDAHEITNVLGLAGLRLMLEEARTTPLMAYIQVASCVPASSLELESPGAVIGPAEIAEAMSWGPDVIALGEVMNFPGVVYGEPRMIGEIQEALAHGRVVDGHYTWPPDDRLVAYAAAGITGDHENVTAEDVLARLRLGMYAKMRRGSAWHDVAPTIRAYTEHGVDTRRMVLVTDDRSSESLLAEGHMDFVVRHAIQQGVPPLIAIQMATINTAERFGVARDVGTVTPGSYADIILLDGNLSDVNVSLTVAAGVVVAENGRMSIHLPAFSYPPEATSTVRLARELRPADFAIEAPPGKTVARVIRVIENHVETKEELRAVTIRDGRVHVDPTSDLCKLAVVERHRGTGAIALGLVTGVGFDKPAALATTVAHDSHNLMILGNSDRLMAEAGNRVARCGGGIAVLVEDNGELREADLPLPIAGLMSPEPFERVAELSQAVSAALVRAGCRLNYAVMTLSLLSLVVLPELHLSDKGLVRVDPGGFSLVELFV